MKKSGKKVFFFLIETMKDVTGKICVNSDNKTWMKDMSSLLEG